MRELSENAKSTRNGCCRDARDHVATPYSLDLSCPVVDGVEVEEDVAPLALALLGRLRPHCTFTSLPPSSTLTAHRCAASSAAILVRKLIKAHLEAGTTVMLLICSEVRLGTFVTKYVRISPSSTVGSSPVKKRLITSLSSGGSRPFDRAVSPNSFLATGSLRPWKRSLIFWRLSSLSTGSSCRKGQASPRVHSPFA